MPNSHEMLHVPLATDPSELPPLGFADGFDALYAGVALTTAPILAFINYLPALKLGHWMVFLYGVALLIYGSRQGVRNDAS